MIVNVPTFARSAVLVGLSQRRPRAPTRRYVVASAGGPKSPERSVGDNGGDNSDDILHGDGANVGNGGANEAENSPDIGDEESWNLLGRRVSELREKMVMKDRQCARNWHSGAYSTSIVAIVPGTDFVRRMSVDDHILACGTANGSICLFNLATRSRVVYIAANKGQTSAVCLQGAFLASVGAADQSITVWNIAKYRASYEWEKVKGGGLTDGEGLTLPAPVFRLEGHTNIVTSVKIDAVGMKLYSSSIDGTIRCWSLVNGELVRTIQVGEPVLCMTTTARRYVLAGCVSGRVQAFEAEKGLFVLSIHCHGANVTALDFHDETQNLATGDSVGNVKLWSFNDARCIGSFPKHSRAVMAVQVDETKLVSASRDGTVAVASIQKLTRLFTITGYTGFISSLSFDKQRLLCDGTNNILISHRFDAK